MTVYDAYKSSNDSKINNGQLNNVLKNLDSSKFLSGKHYTENINLFKRYGYTYREAAVLINKMSKQLKSKGAVGDSGKQIKIIKSSKSSDSDNKNKSNTVKRLEDAARLAQTVGESDAAKNLEDAVGKITEVDKKLNEMFEATEVKSSSPFLKKNKNQKIEYKYSDVQSVDPRALIKGTKQYAEFENRRKNYQQSYIRLSKSEKRAVAATNIIESADAGKWGDMFKDMIDHLGPSEIYSMVVRAESDQALEDALYDGFDYDSITGDSESAHELIHQMFEYLHKKMGIIAVSNRLGSEAMIYIIDTFPEELSDSELKTLATNSRIDSRVRDVVSSRYHISK